MAIAGLSLGTGVTNLFERLNNKDQHADKLDELIKDITSRETQEKVQMRALAIRNKENISLENDALRGMVNFLA